MSSMFYIMEYYEFFFYYFFIYVFFTMNFCRVKWFALCFDTNGLPGKMNFLKFFKIFFIQDRNSTLA